MSLPAEWIVPDWPAAANVRAFVTTRAGGVSTGEYGSMNLGLNSGDDPAHVERNRAIVRSHLPSAPAWLAQVHGTEVARVDSLARSPAGAVETVARADAAIAALPGHVAVVLTADCMPLFLADRAGRKVAVAHAGWRGLAAGVVERTLEGMAIEARDVVAWMGPAIGPTAFEVGAEVKAAFERADPQASSAFAPHAPGKFMADLYALARQRLERRGVREVHGGGFCTYRDDARFFSYRRVQKSGRMGAFIWMD
ncbi:MAG TPA: peptidoglycan editing factor PgeF [Usitatibacter sp.]|nr:peptidoglycan editing factor PgeF [Usitatibacter sp.]